ncbi:MAG: metallophosphatase [Firmicutes bacterium]|nr:metallophosphatase [Bacillota bacterium]
MIYITGDTHGELDYNKLAVKNFPDQKNLTKDDYVIIAGDFGGVWAGLKDKWLLNWLQDKPFTTLFVDGNHENFSLLNQYPQKEWNGGNIHEIRPSVYHLMRGQVFTMEGKNFFTFGGADSIDKEYRKPYLSWWPQEIPSQQEFKEGIKNLQKHNNQVDYVITHTAPVDIIAHLDLEGEKLHDPTTKMLDEFETTISFTHWYFGHFHQDKTIGKFTALYDKIQVLE